MNDRCAFAYANPLARATDQSQAFRRMVHLEGRLLSTIVTLNK